MGFYIAGPAYGKSDLLIEEYEASWIDQIDAGLLLQRGSEDKTIVVIGDSGTNEIAALAYDVDELQRLVSDMGTTVSFLKISKSGAYELAGYGD